MFFKGQRLASTSISFKCFCHLRSKGLASLRARFQISVALLKTITLHHNQK
ncbi:hypothetical protein Patl1_24136 [Pistacia atlantica]|uniref:Uncharacterized protein n=1 Tax=Pistacia atlantica TaxID=434234 RepID=A0ACC1A0V0_9ROSI|nr:hypothetical protein Patl1_24136 [Pistacia atlantica]